ncbi:MAG: 1,4-alpha-glucan branching protein GlgB [Vicinamibacteria bacterium]|jgi:1,4-alpha-glucan branching enzyme|nr:1,4-alpha-glucan branching protein GlgB [Vicinamibacteria bacterium]
MGDVRDDVSRIGEQDLHFFAEGTHAHAQAVLGSHPHVAPDGERGTCFAVWAPNARSVAVMGEFNGWSKTSHPLALRGDSGIWEGFVPGVGRGDHYKYHVVSTGGHAVDKADPFAVHHETPPETGSIVWDLDYEWGDAEWMAGRAGRPPLSSPMSIYELHLGSWRRVPEDGGRSLSYREAAERLADHVAATGFTHVELLPVMEHPFFGSWGYQSTGYFAPSSRHGTPQDLMFLIDCLHQRGVGVILDWVPSHFPGDEHGLVYFDGTHLYEHEDPRQGFHPDWKSHIFNYGRHEVRSFLLSSALHWLEAFHADGLRVDAVASMLYLDYSRKEGEWVPNAFGGRENLEAISFLRELNTAIYREQPSACTIAEESTSWPMVSRPGYVGGLGFGFKWDMGWMHDTLEYMAQDPVHRKFHHGQLTFRTMYAWAENFVLPLSHDEVVHGKGSLYAKMPGDHWQKLASLRLLYSYMYAQPGKKLLFMGAELGQQREWNHDDSLDWHLLDEDPLRAGLLRFVGDLNRLYRQAPALWRRDAEPAGFRWIDCNDPDHSTLSLARHGAAGEPPVVVALNFTPVPRANHRVGVPAGGFWREALNSDASDYGGAGWGNFGGLQAAPVRAHGREQSVNLTLPPLGAVFLVGEPSGAGGEGAVVARSVA